MTICDLCKHEPTDGHLLCPTCSEAVYRLVKIENKMFPDERMEALAATHAVAA